MKKNINFSDFKKQIGKEEIASIYLFLGEEDFVKNRHWSFLPQKLLNLGWRVSI